MFGDTNVECGKSMAVPVIKAKWVSRTPISVNYDGEGLGHDAQDRHHDVIDLRHITALPEAFAS